MAMVPCFAVVAEFVESGLFDLSGAGGEEDVTSIIAESNVVSIFIDGALKAEHGGDAFLRLKVEHVLDAATDRSAGTFRKFIHALDIDAAGVGEEQEVVVRLDGEEVFDEIVFHILRMWLSSPFP